MSSFASFIFSTRFSFACNHLRLRLHRLVCFRKYFTWVCATEFLDLPMKCTDTQVQLLLLMFPHAKRLAFSFQIPEFTKSGWETIIKWNASAKLDLSEVTDAQSVANMYKQIHEWFPVSGYPTAGILISFLIIYSHVRVLFY